MSSLVTLRSGSSLLFYTLFLLKERTVKEE